MKLFAIKINKTVNHVMWFEDEHQFKRTFVIENNVANPILLTFPKGYHSVCGRPSYPVLTEKGTMNVVVASVTLKEDSSDKNLIRRTLNVQLIGKCFQDHEASKEELGKADEVILNAISEGVKASSDDVPSETKKADLDHLLEKSGFNPVKGVFVASLNKGTTALCYDVVFSLKTVDKEARTSEESCSCRIVLSPPSMIFHATLDFGSEASQILEFRQNADNIRPSDRKKLFREMATLFGHQNEIDLDNHASSKNRDFIQYDVDEQLFRSHFFVPKRVNGKETFNSCDPKSNSHIVMFNTYDEVDNATFKDTHFTLPNVKIASLMPRMPEIITETEDGDGEKILSFSSVTDFCGHFFYRSAINAFVYQIIDDIYSSVRNDDRYAFVNLTVLMPNVYNQSQLGDRMRDLHTDIEKMISEEPFKAVIGGVEVNSISESDASILGYMTVFPQDAVMLEKGNFLIMDAGKGTLDLSVLRFDPDANNGQNYISLYRSGIVGSGNAISYALFLDLLSMMLKEYSVKFKDQALCEECMRTVLRELVQGGDENLLTEMMMYIDHYKCLLSRNAVEERPSRTISKKLTDNNESPQTGDSAAHVVKLDDNNVSLREIVEWLKRVFSSPLNPLLSDKAYKTGPLSYMTRMIDIISDDAFRNFGFRGNIDYVVLSGRGFLLPQFADAVKKRLSSWCKKGKNENITYPFKDVLASNSPDGYNAKNICLFALLNRKYDGRTVGKPEHIKHGEDPFLFKPEQEASEKTDRKRRKAIKELIHKLFADYGGVNTIMSDDDFVKGMTITLKNKFDLIRISGTYYRIPENGYNGARATIYFNGSEFVFSCNGEVRNFSPAALQPVDHIFESLFPYGITPSVIPLLDNQTGQSEKDDSAREGKSASNPKQEPGAGGDNDTKFNDFYEKL